MKVKETEDKFNRALIVFTGVKKFSEVTDWLFDHYNGYKFGIVIDVTGTERGAEDNSIYVNFLDELQEEVNYHCDYVRDGMIYRKR